MGVGRCCVVTLAGELEHNMVGVTDDLGRDFVLEDVERLLARCVCVWRVRVRGYSASSHHSSMPSTSSSMVHCSAAS
jgi:hypothetical protein